MKRMCCVKYTILIMMFGLTVNGQTVISSLGGKAIGTGGTVEFTAGQVAYAYYKSENGSISEGVQQTFDIGYYTPDRESDRITLGVQAYPNPVKERLQLQIEGECDNMHYTIYSAMGQVLCRAKIYDLKTSIDMSAYAPGLYLLNVGKTENSYKTFTIIKK